MFWAALKCVICYHYDTNISLAFPMADIVHLNMPRVKKDYVLYKRTYDGKNKFLWHYRLKDSNKRYNAHTTKRYEAEEMAKEHFERQEQEKARARRIEEDKDLTLREWIDSRLPR